MKLLVSGIVAASDKRHVHGYNKFEVSVTRLYFSAVCCMVEALADKRCRSAIWIYCCAPTLPATAFPFPVGVIRVPGMWASGTFGVSILMLSTCNAVDQWL